MGAIVIGRPSNIYDIDAFFRVQRFFRMRRKIPNKDVSRPSKDDILASQPG